MNRGPSIARGVTPPVRQESLPVSFLHCELDMTC
jgi:hypothetical protein